MNEPKMISEVEAVKRERKAFAKGLETFADLTFARPASDVLTVCGKPVEEFARGRYPLPKITQPRVVTDQWGVRWRCAASYGCLEWQEGKKGWAFGLGDLAVTPSRVKLWSDLIANPTEEIEAGADS